MARDLSNEEFLNKIEGEAAKRKKEVHGYERCVLAALMAQFELGNKASVDLIQKVMLSLSGGIAQKRNTCAAALGGLMGIGIVCFPGKLEDAQIEDIMKAMAIGRQYAKAKKIIFQSS